MRVVILGCGRVGSTMAADLDRLGHAVSIIDTRNEAFQRFLPADFGGDAVLGNGIDEDVLQRAGIDQADFFAALADDDNVNIMAAQVAKLVYQVPKVICRIYDRERNETFRALGLETVAPVEIAAARIKDLVEGGPRRAPAKQVENEAGG
jgi:trk/ktr system potassium uptake protein